MKGRFTIPWGGAQRRPFGFALILALCLALMSPAWAQTGKSTATKKSSSTKKSVATKQTAAKKKASKGRRSRRTARTTWRNRQKAPMPERYRAIEQSLIDKGYLKEPADGVWGQASVEALWRFQREHDLEPTGKIDSLSLIALGLGPKYETPSAIPPPPNPPPSASPN
jgi:peptidoglycan hydrolase-like protein with peptidoglycan-binding domain